MLRQYARTLPSDVSKPNWRAIDGLQGGLSGTSCGTLSPRPLRTAVRGTIPLHGSPGIYLRRRGSRSTGPAPRGSLSGGLGPRGHRDPVHDQDRRDRSASRLPSCDLCAEVRQRQEANWGARVRTCTATSNGRCACRSRDDQGEVATDPGFGTFEGQYQRYGACGRSVLGSPASDAC